MKPKFEFWGWTESRKSILKNIGNLRISCFNFLTLVLDEFSDRHEIKNLIVNEWDLWRISKKFERNLLFHGGNLLSLTIYVCTEDFYNKRKLN